MASTPSKAPGRIVQVRSRRRRLGPEADLVKAVLKTEFLVGRRLPAVFFHEPVLPTGLPDLVAVYLSGENTHVSRQRLRLQERHVRVLHYLHTVRSARRESLTEKLRVRPAEVERVVRDLENAQLVTVAGPLIRAIPLSRVFRVKYIVAIEAKMSNWRRALAQAAANYWFASHSYILIPPTRVLQKVVANASELGVGVLVFTGHRVQVAMPPQVRKLPTSYGSWLLNEWAMRRQQGRR